MNKNHISITKRVSWTMGHRIPGHALDENLHGHRFELEVTVSSKTSPAQDMVVDITELKKILETKIVEPLDHCFVFWEKDEVMSDFFAQNNTLKHLRLSKIPTMENILAHISDQLGTILDRENLQLDSVRLWESPNSSASISKVQ